MQCYSDWQLPTSWVLQHLSKSIGSANLRVSLVSPKAHACENEFTNDYQVYDTNHFYYCLPLLLLIRGYYLKVLFVNKIIFLIESHLILTYIYTFAYGK